MLIFRDLIKEVVEEYIFLSKYLFLSIMMDITRLLEAVGSQATH